MCKSSIRSAIFNQQLNLKKMLENLRTFDLLGFMLPIYAGFWFDELLRCQLKVRAFDKMSFEDDRKFASFWFIELLRCQRMCVHSRYRKQRASDFLSFKDGRAFELLCFKTSENLRAFSSMIFKMRTLDLISSQDAK